MLINAQYEDVDVSHENKVSKVITNNKQQSNYKQLDNNG
jgi:hypothetical protein